MPSELIPLLERDDADAARAKTEAERVHAAAIEAVLRLGATRRTAPEPDEYWKEAA